MEYHEFLTTKTKTVQSVGFDVDMESINPKLFDWQKHIVRWALKKGRAALFEDCGLGKGQPEGSLILTDKGFVKNTSLSIGDKILLQMGSRMN